MNKRQAIYYDNRTMDRVTVYNLPPNADVMIQVRVLTKYYVGRASDPVTVRTPEGGASVVVSGNADPFNYFWYKCTIHLIKLK